jgi:mannose-1-phosphate guanylyltransferase
MAGGGGTRLWPLSRRERPKQMLKMFGERSLFQIAVDRLTPLFTPEQFIIITSENIASEFQAQCPDIPEDNYVIEPTGRDTAAAIGLAARELLKRNQDAVMAVVTADHFIENENKFREVLVSAKAVAEDDHLVTIGIHPTYPATEFGYVQQGNYLGTYETNIVFRATQFKEKPDKKTARKLISCEDHSWNSGMFIWKAERIMQEFSRHMPALFGVLEKWGDAGFSPEVLQAWEELEKTSIDYGIMERADDVAVIPAKGLGWNDVGSWNALFDVLEADNDGNIIECLENLNLDSKRVLIHKNDDNERLIVTIGVEDLVVVDTGDVLLVCNRHKAQKVREVVKLLADNKKEKFL